MINIKNVLMLSVSCLTLMAAKDVHANLNYNINSVESNLDTKHIYTHAHLVNKHLSSAYVQTASVCFITDTSACGGIGAASGEDNTGGGGAGTPDYELDPDKRCQKEGYLLKSCNSAQVPVNLCPYNDAIFEKCECKKDLVACTKPQYGVGPACGGKYVSCQTDNPRACKEDGYVNNCSSGQKLKKSPRCPYDSSYGICCTERCANNSSVTCTGANVGDDGCGYTCKQCCDDTCPAYAAKTYKGAYTSTTGCGNKCYKCNCPSGTAPNFSGAYAGSSECGSCYKCSDTCSKGATSVSCSSKYKRAIVASTQCGIPCYECQYNSDCDARGTSCSGNYECEYNSCGVCSSCSYNYECSASSTSCSGKGYSCNYNSCGICTSCSYNSDCAVSGTSCSGKKVCEYNSCGICVSCKDNPDCSATPKSCSAPYYCGGSNSCGICTYCSKRGSYDGGDADCCGSECDEVDCKSYYGSSLHSCSTSRSICSGQGGSWSMRYCGGRGFVAGSCKF